MMFDKFEIVDLSVTLGNDLPCARPILMPFRKQNTTWYTRVEDSSGVVKDANPGPFFSEWLIIDEHTGTHFDAPSHFIPPPDSGLLNAGPAGLIYGEDVPLETLMGEALVIDMCHLSGTGEPGVSPYVTKRMLIDWKRRTARSRPRKSYCSTPLGISFMLRAMPEKNIPANPLQSRPPDGQHLTPKPLFTCTSRE
ncbi:MAG: cyclase family protein [Clostridiales bacterium]|nr:cyclase family protein [Clostridiales bacterium]